MSLFDDSVRVEDGGAVVTLLPGFLEANSQIQFGNPTLIGTRIPAYVGLGWVWDCLDSEKDRSAEGLTRENIIALAAFQAGVEWQRRRRRRKDFRDTADRLFYEKHPELKP